MMKKTYICPEMLAVRLNARDSILTLSSPGGETTNISWSKDDSDSKSSVDDVWTKENKSVWDEEW